MKRLDSVDLMSKGLSCSGKQVRFLKSVGTRERRVLEADNCLGQSK